MYNCCIMCAHLSHWDLAFNFGNLAPPAPALLLAAPKPPMWRAVGADTVECEVGITNAFDMQMIDINRRGLIEDCMVQCLALMCRPDEMIWK